MAGKSWLLAFLSSFWGTGSQEKYAKVIKKAENYEFRMCFKTSLSIYTIHIPLAKHSRKKREEKFLLYSSVIKKLTLYFTDICPEGVMLIWGSWTKAIFTSLMSQVISKILSPGQAQSG